MFVLNSSPIFSNENQGYEFAHPKFPKLIFYTLLADCSVLIVNFSNCCTKQIAIMVFNYSIFEGLPQEL